jgi:hypothetical protein
MRARGRGFLNIRQNEKSSGSSLPFSFCEVLKSGNEKMNYPATNHGVSINDTIDFN